jgi:polar amino acid transport system substrate-binding protein
MSSLLLLALACVKPQASEPLRVLTSDIEPFFYVVNGEPAGLEYEILLYFARSLGRELEIEWVEPFEELLPRLARGEGDVAAATLTITPERQERFDFSAPYFPVRTMLVEPQGRESPSLDSLAGETLVTIPGSVYERILSTVPGVKLVRVSSEREMFELVASGRARALATDSPIAFRYLKDFPSVRMGIPLTEEDFYGFALRRGSPLTSALSKHVVELKESGIYFRLLERYFGKEAVEIVRAGRAP